METTGSRSTANLRVIAIPPTMKLIRALMSVAAVMFLVGCGSSPTSNVSGSTPTPVDVTAARAAALTIIVPVPNATGVWGGCTQLASDFGACPFAPVLTARLNYLSSIGFGNDVTGCGEDYITGTQNGLFVAPRVLSTTANADGSVTVVIQRGLPPPNFTVTMTLENSTWLATDLASGTGPSASIFSAKPNC
jgi:hypothetical protein